MPQQQNLMVPIAIVVAGALVAGALYFAGKSSDAPTPQAGGGERAITLAAVSEADHILGNPDAAVVIVEYTDLECPFCKVFHGTMKEVMAKYGASGQVAWVMRNFPLVTLHPNAPKLAEAAECVAELGGNTAYWNFLDAIIALAPVNTLFDMTKLSSTAAGVGVSLSAFDTCLASGRYTEKVTNEYNGAVEAGGTGTPYNVLVLKEKLSPAGKAAVIDIQSQLRPGTIVISKDGMKVAMNGAMPFEVVSGLIEAVTAQ